MKNYFLFLLLLAGVATFAQIKPESPLKKNYNIHNSKGSGTELYSQMDINLSYGAIASQQFPDFADCRLQSGDDFVVPEEGWTIGSIDAVGVYFNGSGPADSFIVEIYAVGSSLPGASPIIMQSGLSYVQTGDVFEITLNSPISLSNGHYWISIMADMPFGVGGQWGWAWAASPQKNEVFANQDPCNILSGNWSTSWDYGYNTPGWEGRENYDLTFAFYEYQPSVPISNYAIFFFLILMGGVTLIRFLR